MKKWLLQNYVDFSLSALFLLSIGLARVSLAASTPPEPKRLAVATLLPKEGVSQKFAELISDALGTELYKTGVYEVMNREDMERVLKEMSFKPSDDCSDAACIVEMGQALGVGKMVTGSIGKIGDRYVLNAKLIDVQKFKSEVLFTEYWKIKKKPTRVLRMAARTLTGLIKRSAEKIQTVQDKPSKSSDGPRPEAMRIAVTTFEAREGVSKAFSDLMTDIFRTELYKTKRFAVMNREDMDIIFKEILFQQSGACIEDTCVVEMGQALGVPQMVTGNIGRVGKNFVLNAKLIDISTSESLVLATEYLSPKEAMLPEAAFRDLARRIAGLSPLREKGKRFMLNLDISFVDTVIDSSHLEKKRTENDNSGDEIGSLTGPGATALFEYRLTNSLAILGGGGLYVAWRKGYLREGTELENGKVLSGKTPFDLEMTQINVYLLGRLYLGQGKFRSYLDAGAVLYNLRLHERLDNFFAKKVSYMLPLVSLGFKFDMNSSQELDVGASISGSKAERIGSSTRLHAGISFKL